MVLGYRTLSIPAALAIGGVLLWLVGPVKSTWTILSICLLLCALPLVMAAIVGAAKRDVDRSIDQLHKIAAGASRDQRSAGASREYEQG